MGNTKLLVAVVLMIVCFINAIASPVSKDTAIRCAAQFCVGVNWNLGNINSLSTRDLDITFNEKKNRLEVYNNDYTIRLDSKTGKIKAAIKINPFRGRTSDNVRISANDARKYAAKYLKAAGITLSDYILECNYPDSYCDRPGNKRWEIIFRKKYKGYLFNGNNIIVLSLDPLDGSLLTYGNPGETQAPASLVVKIKKDQASKLASNFLGNNNIKVTSVDKTDLYIVNPDNYWKNEFNNGHSQKYSQNVSSRLAWVISLQSSEWEEAEIWVDAEKGTIIGGVHSK